MTSRLGGHTMSVAEIPKNRSCHKNARYLGCNSRGECQCASQIKGKLTNGNGVVRWGEEAEGLLPRCCDGGGGGARDPRTLFSINKEVAKCNNNHDEMDNWPKNLSIGSGLRNTHEISTFLQ